MAIPERVGEPREIPKEDHRVILRGASWSDYERVLELRGEKAEPRITFLRGCLEIMSPSRSHESLKSILGCLVEVYCLERGIEFCTYGSWTLKNREVERGAEADECYVFGTVPEPERPDLVIEVVWASGGLDKLEVYRSLGVPEVWYWQRGVISVYVLRDGTYTEVKGSEALSGINLRELARFMESPTTSAAMRAYRAALQAHGPGEED